MSPRLAEPVVTNGLAPTPAPGSATAVARSRRRLEDLPRLHKAFGVIRMWPDQAVAEHENISRLRDAANLLGVRLVELDKFGHILGSPRKRVTNDDVDFVLHLHFETAKTYDATSIAALWNPTQFYFDWGFERHWNNQMSHDIFAYTGAPEIRTLVRASRGAAVADEMPLLNHTLAEPIIPPTPHDHYRIMYCGINWEKLTNKPERHIGVLRELDALDLLDVYGPESIKGIKVWEGYKGYKGPLPFDGRTIIGKISQAGACLVFSSEAHIRSGIMSNRLFEAMAGGAVVIGDEHPFIEQALGSNYVRVPTSLPNPERVRLIAEALRRFNRLPDEALAMARAAQAKLVGSYHLCDQLAGLFEAASRFNRATQAAAVAAAEPIVDIVIQPVNVEATAIVARVEALARDLGDSATLILLVDASQHDWFLEHCPAADHVLPLPGRQGRILTPYECIALARSVLGSRKIAFMLGTEEVFAEPFLAACRDAGDHPVALLGHVLKHHDTAGNPLYDFFRIPDDPPALHDAALGSAVFDRAWLENNAAIQGASWKDACRASLLETGSIVDCPRTSLVIDLKAFERISEEFRTAATPPFALQAMARLSAGMNRPISSNAVLVRPKPAIVQAREAAPPNVAHMIHGLDSRTKWGVLLDLYHAAPLPRWMRHTITFFRKRLGIQ
jgi:hypothetical protein